MAGFHAAHMPPAVKFKGASRKSESGLRLEPWAPLIAPLQAPRG